MWGGQDLGDIEEGCRDFGLLNKNGECQKLLRRLMITNLKVIISLSCFPFY